MRESEAGQTPHVRVDGYTRMCLTAIAILLTVLIIGLWARETPPPGAAHAVPPVLDPSAQRASITESQDQTNLKLDQLMDLLKSGQVKVQVVEGGAGGGGPGPQDSHEPPKP